MSRAQSGTPEHAPSWWVVALRGLVAILFGLAALFWPGLILAVLIVLFGAYALVDGILAVMVRREIENGWSMALSGVLSVILGIVLILLPGAVLLAYTWVIGLLALALGIALIYYAFRVRGEQVSGSSRVI
jgi:uncharacterized membrane protein HdeD (DUF308 family)